MTRNARRLLVVEDETAIREPVVTYLVHLGFHVDAAENGIEALHCIRNHAYDLIILDIKMPYIDGKQLSQVIEEEGLRIPVLVTTAVETNETIALEVGRLHKVYSLKELEGKVREILGSF